MSHLIVRAVSHPLVALAAALLGGLFEFIALQRSRLGTFGATGKRRVG
ncbi:hypothetical protein [Rhodocyclus tenuis]|uniref:Uncharacterized protein n=1 Tax=Rhodocyclus tenuis TaxID=1066 RepID=A0A840G2Q0_RHOTE|nr:hypothetical protein [Rhodocyclus tenuis]MBB4246215.1 hypothetical protein [Rhodocyclus tenuis]